MLGPIDGASQLYLENLDRIQETMDAVQRQVSSGVKVGKASDDPAAVPRILRTQADIARHTQAQTNLGQVQAELQTGDGAMQNAIRLIDQAISAGSQGASGPPSNAQFDILLQQVRGIQESIVGIAGTAVNGRYIFSGDFDTGPMYELDASQPDGVRQLVPAQSTATVTDEDGNALWIPPTAKDIFAAPGPANVFGGLNALAAGLEARDTNAVQSAITWLKAAGEQLNREAGLYGIAQNRVSDALNSLSQSLVAEKQALSSDRDTDVPAAAIQLSQATVQQQAALSARARVSQLSLFDFFG